MLDQINKFNEITAEIGSTYSAVNYVSQKARSLRNEIKKGYCRESDVLTSALFDTSPKVIYRTTKLSRKADPLHDVLENVIDPQVISSVKKSFGESLSIGHLIYVYNSNMTDYQKMRVRILVRMIWYNISNEGGLK